MDKENMTYKHDRVLAREKNEIMSFGGKWMGLEFIVSSKITQTQKRKVFHSFFHVET
jgi:hypothetical protein